jgi:hypothetical protein
MTATVRLAGENHQPFSALWRFEQGQLDLEQLRILAISLVASDTCVFQGKTRQSPYLRASTRPIVKHSRRLIRRVSVSAGEGERR